MEDDRVCRPNKTEQDLGVTCSEMHGKIWAIDAKPNPTPPLHINCRCWIEPMEMITVEDVNASQRGIGYYIWQENKSEPYENRSGHLPSAQGRTWREIELPDEDAVGGMVRVLFSNDGLIFLTRDHYRTFMQASIDIFRTFVEVERGKVVADSNTQVGPTTTTVIHLIMMLMELHILFRQRLKSYCHNTRLILNLRKEGYRIVE